MNVKPDAFAPLAGVGAGVCGLVYAVAVLLLPQAALAALALIVGGLFTSAVLVAVYEQVRALDPVWTQRGVIMAVTGAAGAIIHGGYDLANALHPPPPGAAVVADLPSQVDPRGLITFFMLGLGVGVLAGLMGRRGLYPFGLVALGYVLAGLLILTYLARLLIRDAANPLVLVPAGLLGVLVQPAWFIWLGWTLWRQRAAGSE
jgi:hypothetical protein